MAIDSARGNNENLISFSNSGEFLLQHGVSAYLHKEWSKNYLSIDRLILSIFPAIVLVFLVRFSRQVFRYCQRANYSNVKLARTGKQGQTEHVFVPTFSLFSRAESTAEASARCYGHPVYTRICSCFSSETDAIKLRAV